ncbi:hypothetical protein [Streptomyces sp. NPDC059783]|uniref:hypothetical protein n=1 Tax=Streptomyces sp. NPDC059783 TaxID=3346944 RepID=UPI00365CB1B0
MLLTVAAGTVPAQAAAQGGRADKSQGNKQQIMRLVRAYFVERDKGWLTAEGTVAKSLAGGEVADGPRRGWRPPRPVSRRR